MILGRDINTVRGRNKKPRLCYSKLAVSVVTHEIFMRTENTTSTMCAEHHMHHSGHSGSKGMAWPGSADGGLPSPEGGYTEQCGEGALGIELAKTQS